MSRYEVDSDNVVKVWFEQDGVNDAPVLFQPFSPETGQPWDSKEEAEGWAAELCARRDSITDITKE